MGYRIGIDAGSKTIKIVALDDGGKIVFCFYRRHRANIKETLVTLLQRAQQRHWDVAGRVCVTGSAGRQIADDLGLPFVQEVEATTIAVRERVPHATGIVELGGEDAKIVYLDGRLEQRMNATCAGGTGAFIDTIARMLGLTPKELSAAATHASVLYPIASRCAVFAQTDVRPLLVAGARKADVAASVLQAVVDQTVTGLACGRPLSGTIVFLGGPCEFLPSLVERFRTTLGLDERTGIKPDYAQFFPAFGAASFAGERKEREEWHLSDVACAMEAHWRRHDELDELAPLFADDAARRAFVDRHRRCCAPRFSPPHEPVARREVGAQARLEFMTNLFARSIGMAAPADTPRPPSIWDNKHLFLGIDAGSTAVKMVLVDEDGALVNAACEPLAGDVLATATRLFERVYSGLPRSRGGNLDVRVAHTCVTGYGEDLLKAALGADFSVVETVAHLKAATHLVPDVDFILDIGGQDIKALWVRDGRVDHVVLNEACSSGCGSLIEGFAHSFGESPLSFARLATDAAHPVDLGTRCTVFMTSRVRHAQKLGTPTDDIAAGLAYSVVKNALFKVIGIRDGNDLGRKIVVEGGTFMSDAVLRAFELVSGREVVRPDISDVMGAYGAALIARERGAENGGESGLLPLTALRKLEPERQTLTCAGCANSCLLTVSLFPPPNGHRTARVCVTGNRCARGERIASEHFAKTASSETRLDRPPNVVKMEQRLLARYENTTETAPSAKRSAGGSRCVGDAQGSAGHEREPASGARGRIGLPGALGLWEARPFWTRFFECLGYIVVAPGEPNTAARREGLASIPSESVCHPAKLYHIEAAELVSRGVDALFMPLFARSAHPVNAACENAGKANADRAIAGGTKASHAKANTNEEAISPPLTCPVSAGYAEAVISNLAPLRDGVVRTLCPWLPSDDPASLAHNPAAAQALAGALDAPEEEVERALACGAEAHEEHCRMLARAARRTLSWMERTGQRGIVIAARPYHADPRISHGIDQVLTDLGYAVLNTTSVHALLRERDAEKTGKAVDAISAPGSMDGRNVASQAATAATPTEESLWQAVCKEEDAVRFAAATPGLHVVHLTSFGCGIDALEAWRLHRILDNAEKPFTSLKIDEMVDLAHIRIRLRTLDAALRERATGLTSSQNAKEPCRPAHPQKGNLQLRTVRCVKDDNYGVPGKTHEGDSPARLTRKEGASAPAGESTSPQRSHLHPTCSTDVAEGVRVIGDDVCYPACALAGQIARALATAPAEDPASAFAFHLPPICKNCLLDALPAALENALGQLVQLVEDAAFPVPASAERCIAADERIPIGIVGNGLMCFDTHLNRNLASMIEREGCRAVLPHPKLVLGEDVRFLPQIERFRDQGVHDLIYVQSFGCLKGHVQARGALRELERTFPDLRITVIDCDAGTSAINQESRVMLALSAAKREAARPADREDTVALQPTAPEDKSFGTE